MDLQIELGVGIKQSNVERWRVLSDFGQLTFTENSSEYRNPYVLREDSEWLLVLEGRLKTRREWIQLKFKCRRAAAVVPVFPF